MARRYEAIDESFVVRPELEAQGIDITVPVSFGSWPGDGGTDDGVVEHPGQCEGDRGGATPGCMLGNGPGNLQRLRSPFGLLDTLVAAADTRVRRRWCIAGIFTRQHTPSQRAVGHHTHSVVSGCRQLFHLRRT